MDRFDTSMKPDEIEAIRQFIIKRANETYQREVDARKNDKGIPENATLGITP